jgi:iron only hydrogenase large subunit-like protein
MEQPLSSLELKPRILYEVAKAAWDGTLAERREDICRLVCEEFGDRVTRHRVANQIRVAMGLSPHELDTVEGENDADALMGLMDGPFIVNDPEACKQCPEAGTCCGPDCPLLALSKEPGGAISIDHEKCLGEGHCLTHCSFGGLAEKSQFVPLISLLRDQTSPVYASVAPAFTGQFGPDVTPGKLRSALLHLGFAEMVETALYADLITMKEAFEFDEHVQDVGDFLITSCCCPVWIKLIEGRYPGLASHISPSVSPMIASGRILKTIEPQAKVVFIGPCIAKKTEATLPDVAGAIDFVLTFQELAVIFQATGINPATLPDEENSLASRAGRIYARTGGVSEAVADTLAKIRPARVIDLQSLKVHGIPNCQKVLEQASTGSLDANFIEGMACVGGCVGGPGRIVGMEVSTPEVNRYGNAAPAATPVENPQVYHLLTRLGLEMTSAVTQVTSPAAQILSRCIQKPIE